LYDFSVLNGVYSHNSAWKYDFVNAPLKKIYKFSNDILNENANGVFVEF
jgi:hypothetical protein